MQRNRKNTDLRKRQILDAARKLIVRHGSEHLTARALAEQVGFTEAALYRHFKSKREILSFLMKSVTDGLIAEMERVESSGIRSAEEFGNSLRYQLSAMEQRKGMSFLILAEVVSLGDSALNQTVFKQLQRYLDKIGDVLSKGAHTGYIKRGLDIEACATMVFGMMQGLVTIWALSDYKLDLVREFDSLWGIVKKGIEAHRE